VARLDPALAAALVRIGAAANEAREPWWIIGSAAMALHGAAPGKVRDIDLLMAREDAQRLFGARLASSAPPPPSDRFRSDLFARWDEKGHAVELMAGFHVRDRGAWRPVVPQAREPIGLHGTTLYTPGITGLIALCDLFGRPKDASRKQALERL
jgi:hypothetical protein